MKYTEPHAGGVYAVGRRCIKNDPFREAGRRGGGLRFPGPGSEARAPAPAPNPARPPAGLAASQEYPRPPQRPAAPAACYRVAGKQAEIAHFAIIHCLVISISDITHP